MKVIPNATEPLPIYVDYIGFWRDLMGNNIIQHV